MGRLVIDGNNVYEIDEECIRRKENQKKGREAGERKRESGINRSGRDKHMPL